jgi:two-component system, NarL family, sensor kinase
MKRVRKRTKKTSELEHVLARVAELEETLRAIRTGEVDAVVVNGPVGDQVFTLQGAEHPYRLLVETIDEGAATLSDDGTVLYSNKSFAGIFGAPLERFIGSPIHSFVSNEHVDDLKALLRSAKNSSARGEIRLKNGAGRQRTVRLTLSPSRQMGVETICAVATELTELLETNDALRVTETSLRQLSGRLLQLQDEERRRIARDLHDTTGQKIAFLSMSLDHLGRLMDKRKGAAAKEALEESREVVRKIGEEIRTLSYLLHPPLLDESGLGSALRWYAEGFQKRSGIKLTVDITPDLGRLSMDAETVLFRVVQESLTNVHRYSGSPEAEIRVCVNDVEVRLEVIDHGKGIEPARAPMEGAAALGVGIPGMRERLHQLGGHLGVDFGRNGTRVVATIPLKKMGADIGGISRSEAPRKSDGQTRFDYSGVADGVAHSDQRRRILIADDHEVMRRGVRGLLEGHDEWAVCGEAVEGNEAVAKSRELRPDLVILDINMPGLTGIDAALQIRRENSSTKVLFFTVHESAQTVREVIKAGGQGYVAKSRAGEDLVEAVRSVLDGKSFFPVSGAMARFA